MTSQNNHIPAVDLRQPFCRCIPKLEVNLTVLNRFGKVGFMIFVLHLVQIHCFQKIFINFMTSQNPHIPAEDLRQLFSRSIHKLKVYMTVLNRFGKVDFMIFVLNSLQIYWFQQIFFNLMTSRNPLIPAEDLRQLCCRSIRQLEVNMVVLNRFGKVGFIIFVSPSHKLTV